MNTSVEIMEWEDLDIGSVKAIRLVVSLVMRREAGTRWRERRGVRRGGGEAESKGVRGKRRY